MKSIEVSDLGFSFIQVAQSGRDREVTLSEIADSFSTLANIIQAGRDNPEISFYTDDLLRVMDTLSSYNGLYNAISETTDTKLGRFEFQESEESATTCDEGKDYDPISARLGTTVKMWLSMNNPDEAIGVLTGLVNNINEDEKEKCEIVHDVTSMIGQFKKDVQV